MINRNQLPGSNLKERGFKILNKIKVDKFQTLIRIFIYHLYPLTELIKKVGLIQTEVVSYLIETNKYSN